MSPARGFPVAEFRARLERAQRLMAGHDLSALLLTTEPEIRYFTGFLTRFWESPTRPWFLVVPATGAPVAVIPSIGAPLMGRTWIADIRTWASPDPGDDGVGLLSDTLREIAGPDGRIGLPSGHETHLRMPLRAFRRLGDLLAPAAITDDAGIMRRLRLTKSPAEIAKIRHACAIAGRAFDRVAGIAAAGVPLSDVFRRFQILALEEGADWVPYLAGGAGPGGYGDVISPAADTPLAPGDVLMLDTGLVWDGYFCDFDRNYAIGAASEVMRDGYRRLIEASDAGLDAARPGARACDVFRAIDRVVGGTGAGRLGHGLGMQLTEWPSLIAADETELTPGMVLTLEPALAIDGNVMVHEENILVTGGAPEFLSPRAPAALPEI